MSIATKRRYLKQKGEDNYFDKGKFRQAGLQFMDMAKDFVDTVKPYKSKAHLKRDLLQAYYGLRNFFWGVLLGALLVPAVLILGVIIGPIYDFFTGKRAFKSIGESLYQLAGLLVNTVALVIRGLTQFVTAPLTLLRAAGRGLYAAIYGWQAFHENAGVKRLVAEGDGIIPQARTKGSRTSAGKIQQELNDKMRKALKQGQPVFIDRLDLFNTHENLVKHYNASIKSFPRSNAYLTTTGAVYLQSHLDLFKSDYASNPAAISSGVKTMITLDTLETDLGETPLPNFKPYG